eukprot:s8707_g2.t1
MQFYVFLNLCLVETLMLHIQDLATQLAAAARSLPELRLREVSESIAGQLRELAKESQQRKLQEAPAAPQVESVSCLSSFAAHKQAVSSLVAWQGDGKPYLQSASEEGCLKRWDLSGQCLLEAQGHEDVILGCFELDCESFASVSRDRTLKV